MQEATIHGEKLIINWKFVNFFRFNEKQKQKKKNSQIVITLCVMYKCV